MRKLINLIEATEIDEKYTADNSYLMKYMKNKEFDPHANWWAVCKWLEKNGMFEEFPAVFGEISSAGDLEEQEPDIFYKLPPEVQKKCAEWVVDYVMAHDPAGAPTWAHMSLNQPKLLPRQTWLVHFSDNALDIAYSGFKFGIDRFDALGLTLWANDREKKYGGYNFAFIANSKDANRATNGKYGEHAVLFQNSGVSAYHHGDEENQVMFIGADVAPKDIVFLKNEGGDWQVIPKNRNIGRDFLFQGTFEGCVGWVEKNFAQYRRVLTGK